MQLACQHKKSSELSRMVKEFRFASIRALTAMGVLTVLLMATLIMGSMSILFVLFLVTMATWWETPHSIRTRARWMAFIMRKLGLSIKQ